MTDDEWVAFYYFWKLQYEARWTLKNNYEKINKKLADLGELNKDFNCCDIQTIIDELEKTRMISFYNCSFVNFPCDKKKLKCIECPNSSKIINRINLIKRYSNLDNYLKKYSFTDNQLIIDSTEFLYNIVRLKIDDPTGGQMLNYYVFNYPVKRTYINEGIKLLGIEKINLTSDSTLSGKVIAEIDLSCPTSLLKLRIESLKNLEFEKTPRFDKLYSRFKIEEIEDFKREKEIIKEKPNLGFNITSFESRAIGLWLYDAMLFHKYETVAQAITALRDGTWFNKGFPNHESNVIAKKALAVLGKQNSADRVFEGLNSKTEKCVKHHEVLNFHRNSSTNSLS